MFSGECRLRVRSIMGRCWRVDGVEFVGFGLGSCGGDLVEVVLGDAG